MNVEFATQATPGQGNSFLLLPDEIIRFILDNLDAITIVNLQVTARRFADITCEPTLWRSLCFEDFQYWDPSQQAREKLRDSSFDGWKDIYAEMLSVDKSTHKAMWDIVQHPLSRSRRIFSVIDRGYRTKNQLMRLFDGASIPSDFHLAQRYWANQAIECLNRSVTLEHWTRMMNMTSNDEGPDSVETALAGLDMFINRKGERSDVQDVFDRLDAYCASVRGAYPGIDQETPVKKARLIARHLRQNRWVGLDHGREYYSLENTFLGYSLKSSEKSSLPLISAVIFCYVCRQFGLDAGPCSFPLHVQAVVIAPKGLDLDDRPLPADHDPSVPHGLTHLYMDPFNSEDPIPIGVLENQLRFLMSNLPRSQMARFLIPATSHVLLGRAAQNIMNSTATIMQTNDHDISSTHAVYAALYVITLHPTDPISVQGTLRELVQFFMHNFTIDIPLVERFILPVARPYPEYVEYVRMVNRVEDEDSHPATPKVRSDFGNTDISHRVGQVFKHKRHGYMAVIYGWDAKCAMPEHWIVGQRVGSLPRGRYQPFYKALVHDETTRYVAEENIVVLGPDEITEDDVQAFPLEVGKYFRTFDKEQGVFISNISDEYPEN